MPAICLVNLKRILIDFKCLLLSKHILFFQPQSSKFSFYLTSRVLTFKIFRNVLYSCVVGKLLTKDRMRLVHQIYVTNYVVFS